MTVRAICDRCGREYSASALKREWTGLMVCPADFDVRHPQELVRGRPERMRRGPFMRPALAASFVDRGDISLSATTVEEGAAEGTLVGILAVSGISAPVFFLTDTAGGRFKVDPADTTRLLAGPVATDYETATSHEITVTALYASPETFTITVTDVVSEGDGEPIGLLLALTKAA